MVVSEGPHDAQEATLARLGIAPLVDLLVTLAAERTSKRGGLLKIALGRAQCLPHELIYVGDSLENDIWPRRNSAFKPFMLARSPCLLAS